ncbi:hypothetical protein DFH06DRAFT_1125079 [Mycena polygramma]|nr:hypothetical protein DFH06DRAFT_1125079 [Mycena polygramma]
MPQVFVDCYNKELWLVERKLSVSSELRLRAQIEAIGSVDSEIGYHLFSSSATPLLLSELPKGGSSLRHVPLQRSRVSSFPPPSTCSTTTSSSFVLLLQNGLVFGIPPAKAPDPNYPACSAKFFPDLAFAGLQKYESAEQAPPEFAIYAFYFFLPTPKDRRVFTTAIQAEEAAKELGISTSRISVHRRLLPTCNAIYSWCKESHDHPTPERCSDRRKRQLGSTLTTYDTDLQKERIQRYQTEYGVVPPPPTRGCTTFAK